MDLLLTVVDDAHSIDVGVHASPGSLVGDTASEVGRHLGSTLSDLTFACDRVGGAVDPRTPLVDSGLCTGDVVTIVDGLVGRDQLTAPTTRRAIRRLVFLEGPMSGHTVVLGRGRHVVGRGATCTIVVDDPNLSRQHLLIDVGEDVVVEDAGSTNGTWLSGKRLSGPEVLLPGTALEVGDSIVTLVVEGVAAPVTVDAGVVPFNRPPRIEPPYVGREVVLPAPPSDPAKVRFPIIMCVVPLIIAAVMLGIYLNMGDSTYAVLSVAFLAMSPIMAVGSWWESKRGNRKDHEEAVADHTAKVDAIVDALERERAEQAEARRRQLPEIGEMFHRARQLAPSLWERGPRDADFLHLRVGTATLPSLTKISIEPGGSDRLRAALTEIPDRFATVPDVPLPLEIPALGGVGICGPENLVAGFCRWLVLQAASLHSPADLAIVGLLDPTGSDDWGFLKWLPHTRLASSPIRGPHLATQTRDQYDLLSRIYDVMNTRAEEATHDQQSVSGPAILVVIDGTTALDRAQVHALLEHGPALGVHFAWLARDERDLPRPCGAVVELTAKGQLGTAAVRWSGTGQAMDGIIAESVGARAALDWARILSPVVDTSRRSTAASELPDSVSLVEVLGDDTLATDASTIVEHWSHGLPLRAPIGISVEGSFSVDLRLDGPHALIAGTTGAGKSEFLQSWLSSLALAHSPSTVTFLLVDYKGGSAFLECAALPHCVGLVTNLDDHLVHRALVSLKAELVYRETVLDRFKVKDMRELERSHPEQSLPSLVIVIDEFATLAKEVPEFVDGVVDIARLGRSLGVHLVLATQRPADAVTETIRANTNLRIALRVANDSESSDVIGSNEAARIERNRPGRALARVGHRELVPFQSAYVGGPARAGSSMGLVTVVDFDGLRDLRRVVTPGPAWSAGSQTELAAIVDAVQRAAGEAGIDAPRVPWLAPLPDVVPFDSSEPLGDGLVRLGLADEPQLQRQRPVTIDLEADGSVAIFGASGSGKSCVLLSIAASAALGHSPREVNIYALDCSARSLNVLEALPQVGAVISGDDHERIERLLHHLRAEIRERADLMASHHVSSLRDFRAQEPDVAPARVVVLVDDYAAFVTAFERVDGGELVDLLPRLIAEGRGVGIHFVVTADRRGALPQAVASSVTRRLVLRMASSEELASLGLQARQHVPQAAPGRGYLDGLEVQVASPGATVVEQRSLMADLAGSGASDTEAPPIRVLPESVDRATLPAGSDMKPVIGLGHHRIEPVALDLTDAGAIVAGPLRSGRTTVLATIAGALLAGRPDLDCALIVPRRSPLADMTSWSQVAVGEAAAAQLVDAVSERLLEERDPGRLVLFIDDVTDFLDTDLDYRLADLAKTMRDRQGSIVVGVDAQSARRSMFAGVIGELRKDKQGLLLQPDVDVDGDLFGVQLPRRARLRFGVGRGYLVRRGEIEIVQVAR